MLSVADAHHLGLTLCIAADTHTHDVPPLSDPLHDAAATDQHDLSAHAVNGITQLRSDADMSGA